MEFTNGVLQLGGVSATELIEHYGSPLYVYETDIIERQVQRLTEAFSAINPRLFYAMKANSNLEILRLVKDHGFGCDAVSPGEIFLARHAGFSGPDIWFTCSNVSDDDLLSIGDEHIIVNVNSMSELDRCLRLGIRNRLALRLNPIIGAGHHRDVVTAGMGVKFGFDIAELQTAREIAECSDMRIVGLHAHIGSGVADITPLVEAAQTVIREAKPFRALEWVNFGGGLSVPYRPDEREFPLQELAAALHSTVGKDLFDRGLRAILEPGRFVVAQSGVLLTTVTSKRISGGQWWVGCDTGFNHLVRPSKYGAYHHIINASRGDDSHLRASWSPDGPMEDVIVAGNLCESGDVFTRASDQIETRPVARVAIDDILAICDAGAYGFSMASIYNARLLPPEVLVSGGNARLVRRRQAIEGLLVDQV
ncbi:MAG TPA: diaminopimelate decarboxylase [Thermoanaerobaculia bacterium]|nr:diaminopimelate decarboxylase [Thermoanaerobaculia bacterium]